MRGRGGLGPEEPNFDVLKNGHILWCDFLIFFNPA